MTFHILRAELQQTQHKNGMEKFSDKKMIVRKQFCVITKCIIKDGKNVKLRHMPCLTTKHY